MDNLTHAKFEYMKRLDRIVHVTETIATMQYTALGLVLGCGASWSLVVLMLGSEEMQYVPLFLGTLVGGILGFAFGGWIGALRVGRIIDALHGLSDVLATERLGAIEARMPWWTRHIA